MQLVLAGPADRAQLCALVQQYHHFEGIVQEQSVRQKALEPLLTQRYGLIYLLQLNTDETIGYLALCWGYSIEFGGRDAFIDEFFIVSEHRGRGLGSLALKKVQAEMAEQGVLALHLEVGRQNPRAQHFYTQLGFQQRDNFQLMSWRLSSRA